MKKLWHILKQYSPWIILILGVNGFCAVLLWLSDIHAFQALIGLLVLASVFCIAVILLILNKREDTRRKRFLDFLGAPTIYNEERLMQVLGQEEQSTMKSMISLLREQEVEKNRLSDAIHDYEEYVEAWAHEAKTPLSLLTMLLDNRSDEMTEDLQAKLDYVCSQLQEDVTQMLYYARLKSSTKDFRFEEIELKTCIEDVLEKYRPVLNEKEFIIINKLQTETAYTDCRGIEFILGQIVSNAVKYNGDGPILTISMTHSEQADILSIEDNGAGVKEYDLPYIFQKGFTGDSTDSRKKATGMGLYLAKRMADDLNLQLEAVSRWGEGFRMDIRFPILK